MYVHMQEACKFFPRQHPYSTKNLGYLLRTNPLGLALYSVLIPMPALDCGTVVSGVILQFECFDPLSSHRPNRTTNATKESTSSAFNSAVTESGDPNCQKSKVSTSFSKLWYSRTRPTWFFRKHPGAPKNLPNTWLILEKREGM